MKLKTVYKRFFKEWREMKKKAIIEYLKEKKMARAIEISKALGISLSTVNNTLWSLMREGRVDKIEEGARIYYTLRSRR